MKMFPYSLSESPAIPTEECGYPVATAPTEVQSAVTLLEKSIYVKTSDLINRVTVAAKDMNGKVKWVTLDPMYHAILVKTAVATVKANGPKHSVASIKEALFIFLLNTLNGKPQTAFFTPEEVKKKPPRAKYERKQANRIQNFTASRMEGTSPPLPHPPPTCEPNPLVPPTRSTQIPVEEECLEQNPKNLSDESQHEEANQHSDSESPDLLSRNFLKLLQERRRREEAVSLDADHTTTSPTERRASQAAHNQEMKKVLNDGTKIAKATITRNTRATRSSNRPGAQSRLSTLNT